MLPCSSTSAGKRDS
uniref:Uncharacterized protein n=1 Tax=Anguilla anguilla TaxID=7936 RepID=A0A0E9QIC1_ANGAN